MRIAFAVLIMALLAGVVVGREKPAELIIEKTRTAGSDFDLSRLERAEAAAPAGDPFAKRSFGGPAAAQPALKQKAEAPLLPFRYMGKVTENGKLEVLLLRGAENFSVVPGEKLGPDYRLDKVTASTLTFTYLPLKTKQTLDIPQ